MLPTKEALSLNCWIAKEVLEIISHPLQPTENSPVLITGSSHCIVGYLFVYPCSPSPLGFGGPEDKDLIMNAFLCPRGCGTQAWALFVHSIARLRPCLGFHSGSLFLSSVPSRVGQIMKHKRRKPHWRWKQQKPGHSCRITNIWENTSEAFTVYRYEKVSKSSLQKQHETRTKNWEAFTHENK